MLGTLNRNKLASHLGGGGGGVIFLATESSYEYVNWPVKLQQLWDSRLVRTFPFYSTSCCKSNVKKMGVKLHDWTLVFFNFLC